MTTDEFQAMMTLSEAIAEIGQAIRMIAHLIPESMAEHFETLLMATQLLALASRMRAGSQGMDDGTSSAPGDTEHVWSV